MSLEEREDWWLSMSNRKFREFDLIVRETNVEAKCNRCLDVVRGHLEYWRTHTPPKYKLREIRALEDLESTLAHCLYVQKMSHCDYPVRKIGSEEWTDAWSPDRSNNERA